MDFINIAKSRSSVRDYNNKKVEPEKLEKILEAAHVAPTAANLQPVHLIVVQSEEGLAKIGKAANIYGTSLAIIVCADHDKACRDGLFTLEKSPSLSGFPAIIAGYEPVFLAKNYENIEFPHKGCK